MCELKKIINRNDYKIVHIHQNSASMAMDARIAKKAKVPIVIGHSHNTSCNILWQHYLFKPFVNKYLDYKFACSKEAGKWVFGKEVKIINNAIDHKSFRFDYSVRKEYREKLSLNDKYVVGFVGRLFNKQKNVSRLIEIFKTVLKRRSDAFLLIVGDGSDRLLLEKQCEEFKDRVLFTGKRNDIPSLMFAMDVFVFPSFHEGLGVVAIEAQATGLKTVVSKGVPAPDILGEQKVLSLDETDERWTEEIIKPSKISRADTENALKNAGYEIKTEAKKLQDFYIKAYTEIKKY